LLIYFVLSFSIFFGILFINMEEIPQEIKIIVEKLKKNGFEAYLVGGCVRDLIRGVKPNDWDIATNARPEKIIKIFPHSFSNNKFGTVTVLSGSEDPSLREVEITPYRIDEKYSDKRHPDKIYWAKTIEEDLARRDFTINAIAAELSQVNSSIVKIVDPFKGQKDLNDKIIRAVGRPDERFSEDALRLIRAVRFAVTLGERPWKIEEKTWQSIEKKSSLLKFISQERLRDELEKIIMSPNAARGIEILRRAGLLRYIIPELEEGFGIEQNKHHLYQIYQHSLLSLNYAARQNFSKCVRLAALLHDVGKPMTKKGEGPASTFYNHEIVGAKLTYRILRRLRFPKREVEKVAKLVRYHLFYYNVGEVGESSVRRLLRKVGSENIDDLLQVRQADRVGSGVPKAEPYKLRHLKYMFEKVSQDPISPKKLKINGYEIMEILGIPPGPKIGQILTCLLNKILEEPDKNKKEFLEKEVKRLGKMPEAELMKEFLSAKKQIENIELKKDEMTKKKYWVS